MTDALIFFQEAKSEDEAVPVFAIIMAIITTGFIFFVLGFLFNKRRTGTVSYSPSRRVRDQSRQNSLKKPWSPGTNLA